GTHSKSPVSRSQRSAATIPCRWGPSWEPSVHPSAQQQISRLAPILRTYALSALFLLQQRHRKLSKHRLQRHGPTVQHFIRQKISPTMARKSHGRFRPVAPKLQVPSWHDCCDAIGSKIANGMVCSSSRDRERSISRIGAEPLWSLPAKTERTMQYP